MEAIVNIALASAAVVILLQYREQRLIIPLLGGEGQDCRIPSSESGARTREPAIASGRIILSQVYVRIDAARRDIGAFSVDNVSMWTRRRKIGRNAEDLAIFDPNALAWREDLGSCYLLTLHEFLVCARRGSSASKTHDCRIFDDEV